MPMPLISVDGCDFIIGWKTGRLEVSRYGAGMGPVWGRAAAGTRGTVGHCLDLASTCIEGEKANGIKEVRVNGLR